MILHTLDVVSIVYGLAFQLVFWLIPFIMYTTLSLCLILKMLIFKTAALLLLFTF